MKTANDGDEALFSKPVGMLLHLSLLSFALQPQRGSERGR